MLVNMVSQTQTAITNLVTYLDFLLLLQFVLNGTLMLFILILVVLLTLFCKPCFFINLLIMACTLVT